MTFETDRLLLRPYRPEDWERVHIYGSDPEFSKYEPWGPNTVEDTQNFIEQMIMFANERPQYRFEFAVCLKEEDLLIGGCGLRREAEVSGVGQLGWAINTEFQNRGYATEAARALIRFGFAELNLSIIYAICDVRNIASFRVMEKLGMKRVGMIRGDRIVKGHLRSIYRYEILPQA